MTFRHTKTIFMAVTVTAHSAYRFPEKKTIVRDIDRAVFSDGKRSFPAVCEYPIRKPNRNSSFYGKKAMISRGLNEVEKQQRNRREYQHRSKYRAMKRA